MPHVSNILYPATDFFFFRLVVRKYCAYDVILLVTVSKLKWKSVDINTCGFKQKMKMLFFIIII